MIDPVIPRGERVRILFDPKHGHARKIIVLASRCNDTFFLVQGQGSHYCSPCFWPRWQCWEGVR